MDLWIIAGVLAPFFNSLVNLTDKFLLEQRVRNRFAYGAMVGCCMLLFALVLFAVTGASAVLSPILIIAALSTGILWGVGWLLYYYLIGQAEISRFIGILYLLPVGVAILARVFLGEKLSTLQYGAIVLAVCGTLFLGTEKQKRKWQLTNAFWLILLDGLLFAVMEVMDKYLLHHLSYSQVYATTAVPLALVLLVPMGKRSVRRDVRQAFAHLPSIALSASFGIIAVLAFLFAAARVPVSLVSSLGPLQAVFVFLLMLSFSTFFPHTLKERATPYATMAKASGVLCVVVASLMLIA